MKRITLPMVSLLALVTASSAVLAQDPTPPARPVPAPRPVAPATPATPAPAPAARPYVRAYGPNGEMYIPREEIDRAMEASRAAIEEVRANMPRINEEAMREAREASRLAMENSRVDMERIREQTREALEAARPFMDAPLAVMPPMPAIPAIAPMPPMAFNFGNDGFRLQSPPAAWAHQDPADSIYQKARELLIRGEYGTSARMFADIQKNYANSAYRTEAQYWEAFARYKIGTTDELHQAAKLLEPLASKITATAVSNNSNSYSISRKTPDNDIAALYARINGALAMRGDADAAQRVAKAASMPGAPCDEEDQRLRTEALSALSQMDPAQALPLLRKVIDRKDECSASLRQNAVLILARRNDAESANLLMSVAKNDPNMGVRTQAINFLSRIPGETGINALEEMLRNEQDARIQRAAIHALNASDNSRARAGMRALIDRKDAPINLRVEAINSLNSDRATNDDAAYLRGLYGKADNDQIKMAIVNTLSRLGGPENDQFVMNVARNNNESSSVRSNALSRFTNSSTVSVADLSKLYDSSAESYELRSRIISILGRRKEPEATDKLVDIVKNSTVINHRTQAIQALVNKKDPRAQQLLSDILDGKKP